MGFRLWGRTESDTTDATKQQQQQQQQHSYCIIGGSLNVDTFSDWYFQYLVCLVHTDRCIVMVE